MKLPPAQLWIGPDQELKGQARSFVRQLFCKNNGCGSCVTCKAIEEKQFHGLAWLAPENYYTVKQIQELFTKVCFTLEPGQKYVIVLERADLFNLASANCLLKSLEEPPEGYHYILLAPRMQGILPTIKSRCVVKTSAMGESTPHRLLGYFTSYSFSKGPELMKELQEERVKEHELDQLFDAVVQFWHGEHKKALGEADSKKAEQAAGVIALVEGLRKKPVMPGSSKLFLKNIYLKMALAFC